MEKAVISSGAAGFLAASTSYLSAAPLGLPIGSQIWPTRSMIKDFPAYVKMMADIGVTRLELCSSVGYGAEFSSLANGRGVRRRLRRGANAAGSPPRRAQDHQAGHGHTIGDRALRSRATGPGEGEILPTRSGVPNAHRRIPARRGQAPAIGAEGQAPDLVGVATKGEGFLASPLIHGSGVPDLRGPIPADRS